MTFKWMRLPAADAAGTATTDTTEVQIGTGLTVPNWANSIKALHTHLIYLALTSDEEVAGYIRITNDGTPKLDPANFPLPIVQCLTGALGAHLAYPVTIPYEAPVNKGDTIHAYTGLDAATTGAHTIQAYILFSSESPRYHMYSQKSSVIAASATANTSAGSATLSTIQGGSSALLGFWNYIHAAGGITAAQSVGGYITVTSTLDGWQSQEIPTNILDSGLGTEVNPMTRPMMAVPYHFKARMSGYNFVPWTQAVNLNNDKIDFTIVNRMDGTNTGAPGGRYGLMWLR